MKRMWFGVGLLAAILVLGIWSTASMDKTHGAAAEDLTKAAAAAMDDEWGRAEALLARAEKSWQKKRLMTAALADHEPMDEAEGLFAQLGIYAKARERAAFSAAASQLATLLQAIRDAHRLTLANLL